MVARVRRAVNAAFDKNALRQAFGGPITGDIPTHWIPPGQPGFDEAGGAEGTGADFMATEEGDLELAKEYMRKAGYEWKYVPFVGVPRADGTSSGKSIQGAVKGQPVVPYLEGKLRKLLGR